jgi:membrane associated rhomboid family serine protease
VSSNMANRGNVALQGGKSVLFSVRTAVVITVAAIAAIWLVQGFNAADGYRLDGELGLTARSLGSLPHILTVPFLHVSVEHIESNTVPLAVTTFLVGLDGLRRYAYVTAIIIVVGGLGYWLLGPSNVTMVGASGLIFGYLGYLVVRGFFARSIWQAVWQLVLGVAVAVYYQWTLVLLYPSAEVTTMHISWQGHLTGLLSGIVAAVALGRRPAAIEPPPPTPILPPDARFPSPYA